MLLVSHPDSTAASDFLLIWHIQHVIYPAQNSEHDFPTIVIMGVHKILAMTIIRVSILQWQIIAVVYSNPASLFCCDDS